MALSDELASRFSSEELIALTNPDAGTQTTIDTGRRDAAIADAQARFRVVAQVIYDNSDARHVMVAVDGVIAYLIKRGGAAPGSGAISMKDYKEALLELRAATTGRRLLPATDSKLEPTDEFDGISPVRPDTDRENFDLVNLTQNPPPPDPGF